MVGKRLTHYIEKQGITKKEFCEKHGLDYNNFVNIFADKLPLGMNRLIQLKTALPYLNTEWLLFGNGEPEIPSSPNDNFVNDPSPFYRGSDPVEEIFLKYLDKDSVIKKIEKIIDKKKNKK